MSISAPSIWTSPLRPLPTPRSKPSSPRNGRLDVVIHNAGHMVFGPAEAFTPEQFAELYDVNVLSTPNSTLSGTVLRGEGRDGCLGRGLRA